MQALPQLKSHFNDFSTLLFHSQFFVHKQMLKGVVMGSRYYGISNYMCVLTHSTLVVHVVILMM